MMKWIELIGWMGAAFLVAALSGGFTASQIPTWYAALAKPSFSPPNWIFGPVWTALYAAMAVAAWLVARQPASSWRTVALLFWWVQLALNFCWSLIFFKVHSTGGALVEVALLWAAILATMMLFFLERRAAGWLMAPYLAWVSFAAVLNLAIWRLN